jgi:hypothetical protein
MQEVLRNCGDGNMSRTGGLEEREQKAGNGEVSRPRRDEVA